MAAQQMGPVRIIAAEGEMIVFGSRTHGLRMLFAWKGSVIRNILPQLLFVLGLSILATLTHGRIFHHQIPLTVAPFTLLGVSLAVFLGFRNSASYDRYWEGRRLRGTLLNLSRSLMRQAQTLGELPPRDPALMEWAALLAGFAHALRHQLRDTDPAADMVRLLPAPEAELVIQARYRPAIILILLGRWVARQKKNGFARSAIDFNLNGLSDVLGGCERLAATPIPFAYSVMIHRTVYLYCFLLPFALVGTVGMLTPVLSVLIAYTFLAIEALAQEIEEPFGTQPNDLPLTALCHGIEDSVREMAGETLPPRTEPAADQFQIT
jgi:putative membrane protein